MKIPSWMGMKIRKMMIIIPIIAMPFRFIKVWGERAIEG